MTPEEMDRTVQLYFEKCILNDELLDAVRELTKRINQMTIEEWEEYQRRLGVNR